MLFICLSNQQLVFVQFIKLMQLEQYENTCHTKQVNAVELGSFCCILYCFNTGLESSRNIGNIPYFILLVYNNVLHQ